MIDNENDIQINDRDAWVEKMAYKHSPRGAYDRKKRAIKMRSFKKFALWGMLLGVLMGSLFAYSMWQLVYGW